MTQEQNATGTEDEFYDDAQSAFPSIEDLDGRLVAIWADSSGTRKGDSGTYTFVETDTMVLDDGVDGTVGTDIVPFTGGKDGEPILLEGFQHSTTGLVSRLKGRIGRKTTPMLGRINSQPSKVNKRVLAYSIAEPTEYDKDVARALRQAIIVHTATRVERAQKADDTAAFE